jgi:hypothetical protein
MDPDVLQRAQDRIERAVTARLANADLDATLERARSQVAALTATTAELEASLPGRIGDAVKDGIRGEVVPVARNLAEIRGLLNHLIRGVEGLQADVLAERHARVDDLAVLVELIGAAWNGLEQRLDRIEQALAADDLRRLPLAS